MLSDVIRFVGDPVTGTGQTIYSVIWRANASGSTQIYNAVTGTFVACNEANWASYAITLSEGCAASYATALPLPLQLPARTYHVATYQRVGGAPDPNADTFLGAGEHDTGNLNLTVLPSVQSACVEEGDDIVFLVSCTTEDGPLTPLSVAVAVEGTGSAVEAAVAGHTSVRKITYTAAAGSAGTNDCVVVSVTFAFPDVVNNYGTVVHKVGVPVYICESAAGGACPTEQVIAAEVLSVLDAAHGAASWVAPTAAAVAAQTDSVLTASHGAGTWVAPTAAAVAAQADVVLSAAHGAGAWDQAGTMTEATIAAQVDVVLSGTHGAGSWVAPTAAAVATQTDIVLTAAHGAGTWGAAGGMTEATIAAQVDVVLSGTHGAGNWESPDAPTVAGEVDAVLTASHGPGGWTTGVGGGTGIEITS